MTPREPGGIAWRKSTYSGSNGDCVEIAWRKSSHSAGNGDCVEVGWRKSTHSASSGNCVEVGWPEPAGVALRDSKHPTGPTLAFATPTWRGFLATLS